MKATDVEPVTVTDTAEAVQPLSSAPPLPSRATANYSLFVLTIVVLFTVLDRQVLALMIEPLKRDFQISQRRFLQFRKLFSEKSADRFAESHRSFKRQRADCAEQ